MTVRHIIGTAVLPYKGWAPYCMNCSTAERMKPTGRLQWQCQSCKAQHEGTCSWLRNEKAADYPNATREA